MPEWNRADFERFYSFRAEPWGHPNTRPPIRLHYHNHSVGQYQSTKYAPLLAQLIGLQPGNSVIMVGCGFNWTARGLAALGADVIGVDLSTYINAQKGQTEEAEIRDCITRAGLNPDTDVIPTDGLTVQLGVAGKNYLDVFLDGGRAAPKQRGWGQIVAEDMKSGRSRNVVAGLMQASARFLITEETLNSISDAEALDLCSVASSYMAQKGATGSQIIHVLSPLQTEAVQQPALNWKSYSQWRTFLDNNGFSAHKICPSVTYGGVTAYGGLL